jgi:hypothetical protein
MVDKENFKSSSGVLNREGRRMTGTELLIEQLQEAKNDISK